LLFFFQSLCLFVSVTGGLPSQICCIKNNKTHFTKSEQWNWGRFTTVTTTSQCYVLMQIICDKLSLWPIDSSNYINSGCHWCGRCWALEIMKTNWSSNRLVKLFILSLAPSTSCPFNSVSDAGGSPNVWSFKWTVSHLWIKL
jgi:hypothetical protein